MKQAIEQIKKMTICKVRKYRICARLPCKFYMGADIKKFWKDKY